VSVSRGRWITKKLARHGTALGMAGTGALAAKRRFDTTPTVHALMYHRFGDSSRDPWCVDTETFEKQVRWLAQEKLAISVDQLVTFLEGRGTIRDGSVLVTADDGYVSVLSHMAPILHRYQVPAVAYVTTGRLGSSGPGAPERYLSWDEAAKLPELGVTLGSHAHTHNSLGRMPLEQARDEGARSRELLQSRLGIEADSFAYPYGMRPDHTPETGAVLRKLGYRSAFIAMHGAIRPGADPHSLPRIKVEGGEGLTMFKLLCRGALDVWRLFDEIGHRLQRPSA
jgi:peptidoglycan/xylan/chitin deacetylase (PgdA/CDA1 family)